MTRGLRRPWRMARTTRCFSSGAWVMRKSPSVGTYPSLTSFRNLPTFQQSNLSTRVHANPFRIRTSEKRARDSRRIRTSKTQDLKFFRNEHFQKNRGGGHAL